VDSEQGWLELVKFKNALADMRMVLAKSHYELARSHHEKEERR
jgi:hypothetical protein